MMLATDEALARFLAAAWNETVTGNATRTSGSLGDTLELPTIHGVVRVAPPMGGGRMAQLEAPAAAFGPDVASGAARFQEVLARAFGPDAPQLEGAASLEQRAAGLRLDATTTGYPDEDALWPTAFEVSDGRAYATLGPVWHLDASAIVVNATQAVALAQAAARCEGGTTGPVTVPLVLLSWKGSLAYRVVVGGQHASGCGGLPYMTMVDAASGAVLEGSYPFCD